MKTKLILSLLPFLVASSAVAQTDAPSPERSVYVHVFRSPSTGLEYRSGNWGVHAGLYTTILNSGGKSTEFFKVGGTYYFPSPLGKRFEVYNTVAYMTGLNRSYKKDSALFVDQGLVYEMGKGFSARLGSGLLFSKGHRTKTNPTIGISYRIKL